MKNRQDIKSTCICAKLIKRIAGYDHARVNSVIWVSTNTWHGMIVAYQYYVDLRHYCEIRVFKNEYKVI